MKSLPECEWSSFFEERFGGRLPGVLDAPSNVAPNDAADDA
jgi:hypothetical protein